MKNIPDEFKACIITKLLAPNNTDIPSLSAEIGKPKDTLYTWRLKHRQRDRRLNAQKIDDSCKINSSDKFDLSLKQPI